MSLFGFDETTQPTTTGLISINCNKVISDSLIINNLTLPIDVGATLIALRAEIDAIPSGLTGATGASGPRGEEGPTGPQGPAGDGPVAIAALALASTTAAGLSTYIAVNNAAVAAINLQLDAPLVELEAHTSDLSDQVATLEQKTTDLTWGSFTGTTFARRVQVTNSGASAGASSVYLGSSDASTFLTA
jgi:hypothetical protein